MLEWLATTSKLKSERRKAISSTPKATVRTPASAYTARRPESTNSRRRARAPYTDAPAPYTASTKPRIRQARPTVAISAPGLLGLELGGAFGDQRVPFPHVAVALLVHGDDHFAP